MEISKKAQHVFKYGKSCQVSVQCHLFLYFFVASVRREVHPRKLRGSPLTIVLLFGGMSQASLACFCCEAGLLGFVVGKPAFLSGH